MSKANYNPPSLTGSPVKALAPPGECQFTKEFQSVPLLERIQVSKTSHVLRFGLPDREKPLNLSTCACILAKANIDGEDVIRPYTPISTNNLKGCFDLLVKDYGPSSKMSNHVCERMNIGDLIDFKHIEFNVKIQAPFPQKHIVLLAGGSGITPFIQALHAILGDESASNKVTMLYGSRVEDDILGRELIDSWAKKYSDKFTNVHVLSEEPEASSWKGLRGYITKDILRKYAPGPSEDVIFFVCGPPPFYNALSGPRDEKQVKGLLGKMGYSQDQVYKF